MAAGPPVFSAERLEEMTEAEREEEIDKLVEYVRRTSANDEVVTAEVTKKMIEDCGISLLNHALETGLDRMRTHRIVPKPVFASLYTFGYRCARDDDYCDMLATHHREKIEQYLRAFVVPSLDAKHGDGLLIEFRKRWDYHKIYAEWMRKLYLYLDREDVFSGSEHHRTTTSVALKLFKDHVFDHKKNDIVSTIQDFVNNDRRGEAVDRSLLKSVVELFLVMGVASSKHDFKNKADVEAAARTRTTGTNETYTEDFERPFIENSRAVYKTSSTDWLASESVPSYLAKVTDTLDREKARVDAYLNPATWPKLRTALVDVMVRDCSSALRDAPTGLRSMLEADRREDLARMYRLFSLWPGGKLSVAAGIATFVKETGLGVVRSRAAKLATPEGRSAAAHDPAFVEELLSLALRFRVIVADCCDNDADFRKELQTAMNLVVNTNARGESDPHPNAELLAAFVDMVMRGKRKGSKLDEAGIGAATEEVHELFLLLNDKDMFQESHRKLLSRRLLTDASFSDASERELIGKLKESQGPTYTGKFEGMLTDLAAPDPTTRGFLEARGAGSGVEFGVRTLCKGHWPPAFQTAAVTVPAAIKPLADEFMAYYGSKQSSRKVDFAFAEGGMTLRGHFSAKGKASWYDFGVGTLQGVTLLHFNSSKTWVVKDLAAAAGLEATDVCKLVHPLVFNSSCRVLVDETLKAAHKAGKKVTKRVEPTHELGFNPKFSSKRKAVAVPDVHLNKAIDRSAVDMGRQHVLDAAIVRIMKSRKTMRFQALITETETQVRRLFAPDPRVTRRRIEHLIGQDYMERDEGERSTLHYVA